MNLVFQSIPPQGDAEQMSVGPDGLQVPAVAGMTYRIVDPSNPDQAIPVRVRKVGDDMVIDLLEAEQSVVIQDYYFVCRFDFRSCVLQLDSHGGGAGSVISAEQIPTERLDDGSLLVWQSGTPAPVVSVPVAADAQQPAAAAPVASSSAPAANETAVNRGPDPLDTRGGSGTKWALVGGLGAGVLALAAGGGSDSPAVAADSDDNAGGGGTVDDSGDNTGGDNTGGDNTDGDNTDGDNTGGDNTGGDNTGGDNTGGDNTGGDNTGGDNTGGDNTGGDNTGGDNTGGDNTGGDNTGGDTDTTAPVAPQLAAIAGDDVISPAEAQSVVVISGAAEPGSVVSVSFGDLVQTVQVDGDSRFAVSVDAADLPAAGTYDVVAVATDAAGNTSPPTSRTITIEAEAPVDSDQEVEILSVVDDLEPGTGSVENNGVTNDSSLLLSGELEEALQPGDRVEVLANGQAIGNAQVTGTDWQFEAPALADGDVSFDVRVLNAADQLLATTQESFVVTIDTTAPPVPAFLPVEGDSVIDEDEAADGVQIEGTGEAGATVQATWLDEEISGLVDQDGSWNLSFETLPDDVEYGANSIRVVQVDAAGNESGARVRNIWLELPDLLGSDENLFAASADDTTAATAGTAFDGGDQANSGSSVLDDLNNGLNSTA